METHVHGTVWGDTGCNFNFFGLEYGFVCLSVKSGSWSTDLPALLSQDEPLKLRLQASTYHYALLS